MIDIKRLSSYYEIRTLTDSDVDDILDLCQHNTLFYEYTEARPTREEIQSDITVFLQKRGYSPRFADDGLQFTVERGL